MVALRWSGLVWSSFCGCKTCLAERAKVGRTIPRYPPIFEERQGIRAIKGPITKPRKCQSINLLQNKRKIDLKGCGSCGIPTKRTDTSRTRPTINSVPTILALSQADLVARILTNKNLIWRSGPLSGKESNTGADVSNDRRVGVSGL